MYRTEEVAHIFLHTSRNDYCLLDPTRDEELVCDGLVSIIYFEDGQISKITHKGKQTVLKLHV